MRVGQSKLLSCIDPRMEFVGNAVRFCHGAMFSLLVSRMRRQSKKVQVGAVDAVSILPCESRAN